MSLLQKRIGATELQDLHVRADGRWECTNCAKKGKKQTGMLSASERGDLHGLLGDPALPQEGDLKRGYRLPCRDAVLTSVITGSGIVTFSDCASDTVPPVADRIASLLVKATPFEIPGFSVSA